MTRPPRLGLRLGAAASGYALDWLFGEPPDHLHPLRAFGSVMSAVERRGYRDDRFAGAVYATTGMAIGLLAGVALRSTAAATYLACGGRALAGAATNIDGFLVDGDMVAARAAAPALVGRDVDALDEKELARAAIESVAENTVDAVVAPLFFAALAGAPGALVYRAANTLDALVGHHNSRYERFGWASARVDDALGFVPARLVAVLVAALRPRRAAHVIVAVRRDAPAHPSPNAGVAESAFAAALGIRLGGTNTYGGIVDVRPALGEGRAPERADIERAVRLSREVGAAAGLVAAVTAILLRSAGPRHATKDAGR